ncbi:hypothetical protein TSUD_212060 [Trifolium subterraneum]|uniref:At2g35280-like TPR domain-containing protein n=1 Tax=Trifolium subterraneum TaxID=3900 RepID=A0A2Z6NHC5_TRISU|nr:hypothetical protein TSUD_212060 [Trifolium subterraneum]
MASRITSKSESSESNNTRAISIESLPTDVLREVVGMVASESIVDLHNVKLCSKFVCKLTEEKDMQQRVYFHKYPGIQWYPNEKQYEFVKLCEASVNTEIVYSEELRHYFNNPEGNVDGGGLQRLKTAAESDHKCAKYVYGMIKLCSENDDSRQEGIEHLHSLRMSRCLISSFVLIKI